MFRLNLNERLLTALTFTSLLALPACDKVDEGEGSTGAETDGGGETSETDGGETAGDTEGDTSAGSESGGGTGETGGSGETAGTTGETSGGETAGTTGATSGGETAGTTGETGGGGCESLGGDACVAEEGCKWLPEDQACVPDGGGPGGTGGDLPCHELGYLDCKETADCQWYGEPDLGECGLPDGGGNDCELLDVEACLKARQCKWAEGDQVCIPA